MIRFLPVFISILLLMAHSAFAGESDVKKEKERVAPSTKVVVRTSFGGYISKRVVSVREMRYRNIIPQKYDFSCGAASMATILKYLYGIEDVKEEEIAKDMIEKGDQEKIRQKGFSLLDLKRYAERKGFKANGYKVKAENLSKLKIPVIVLMTTKGYTHFVVLKGIKDERAYLADPSAGNRSVSFKDFVESWDNVVFVVYKQTDKQPALELTAAIKSPVYNVLRLQDLGLRNYIRLPGEF